MTVLTPDIRRHRSLVVLASALSLVSVASGLTVAHAVSSRVTNCPRPESLVPGTTWHNHKLAPGITLSEGQKRDSRGLVKMHVLRIDTTAKGVFFQPLIHSVAQRTPLSKLAAGHKHLVAAVNTGYFDFVTGAPVVPFISQGGAVVLSRRHQPAVGIGTNGRWESGQVWLAAEAFAGKQAFPVSGVNEAQPPTGLDIYNAAWGSRRLQARSQISVRAVSGNKMQPANILNRVVGANVPPGGYLLVAHGTKAENWLASVKRGTPVGVAAVVKTTAPHPFEQAYGAAVEVVQKAGVTRTVFSCGSANTKQPARTAIGFANHFKTVVIAEVEDHPGTSIHGLDANQMSKLMVQLGVSKAYDLDGSGSTEMLARMPHKKSLSRRTYPADGVERPMPLGLGISSTKVG